MGSMNLTLPTVSSSTGPGWATTLNQAATTIEEHDHSSGKGVQVPSAGLNINAELDCNNKDLVQLRSVRFYPATASPAAAADVGCLYIKSGNFYYKNTAGVEVQITDGSTLSAVSTGAIGGLPSGTAAVSFAAAVYTFISATNTAANIDHAASVIRDSSVTNGSAKAVTIDVPDGLAANYTLTLPGALPASGTKFLRVDSAGAVTCTVDADASTLEVSGANLRIKDSGVVTAKINDLAVTTAKIAANAVTRAKIESVGQQVSSSSSTFTTASTSATDVTNLTVSITSSASARPIVIFCESDGTADENFFAKGTAAGNVTAAAYLLVNSNAQTGFILRFAATAANDIQSWPSSTVLHMFVPAASTAYTIKVQIKCITNCALVGAGQMKLVAYEL